MVKAVCDKCATDIKIPQEYQVVLSGWEARIDLCASCFNRAKDWLRTHPAAEK